MHNLLNYSSFCVRARNVNFIYCVFFNTNVGSRIGAALKLSQNAYAELDNCYFIKNVAFENGGTVSISGRDAIGVFYNCTFHKNNARGININNFIMNECFFFFCLIFYIFLFFPLRFLFLLLLLQKVSFFDPSCIGQRCCIC